MNGPGRGVSETLCFQHKDIIFAYIHANFPKSYPNMNRLLIFIIQLLDNSYALGYDEFDLQARNWHINPISPTK